MAMTVEEAFTKALDQAIEDQTQILIDGSFGTHSDYMHACGIILGLKRGLEEFRSLVSSVEEDD